ncbi:hypothetical protein FGG08_006507 [Glutinoglossum americanum]|uniref:Uncharacterized protein n=1 Tax=Glutinoglossum americanum TaxID=1670608 RepID=A0A9P8L0B1_9PEZI|nr:hypothetical protein FGG08_006507 [Glutinoglossum americanum]
MKRVPDELQVFKCVGGQVPDNDLPEFKLSDVLIFRGDESNLANLLLVGTQGAVTVRGVLEPLRPEQYANFKSGRAYTGPIELRDVSRFAYGTVGGIEDIGIWAAGKSGWFMVDPSAVYAQVYQHMVVAVKTFHFLEDQYHPYGKGKRRFKGTVKDLFAMYADAKIAGSKTPRLSGDGVKALFSEHRDFLISQMIKMGGWGRMGISRYLRNEHPADYSRIEKLVDKLDEPNNEDPNVGAPAPPKCDPFRLDSLQEFPSNQKNKHLVIWDLMTTVQREHRLSIGTMTTDGFAQFLFGCFDINDTATATLLIEACAKELIELMSETGEDSFNWTKRKVYKELKKAVVLEEDCKRVLALPLRKRSDLASPESGDATGEELASDTEGTSRSCGTGQKSGKGRSALRPSAIGATLTTTSTNGGDELGGGDIDDDDTNDIGDVTTTVREGKRKALDDPAFRNTRKCVSAESSRPGSQVIGANSNMSSIKTEPPQLQLKVTKQQPSAQNHRGGYLHCSVDGCNYKVYCTDRTGFDAVINQHLRTQHEKFARILDILDSESKIDQPLSELRGKIRRVAAREGDSPVVSNGESQLTERHGFESAVVGPVDKELNDMGVHSRDIEDFTTSLYSFKPPRGRY